LLVRKPLYDMFDELWVPRTAARCRHLEVIEFDGNIAHRITPLLEITNNGSNTNPQ